ncbi:MAG: extracellular solute-binding protein [Bdellovibrionales bacterium]|nr:extracellular solute-binding protein [Bdellovibrionales bacterium]
MKKLLGLLTILSLSACTGGKQKKEFWIYTSIYKEHLAGYESALEKAFPEVDFKFFQGGSENVAAKVQAELSAGKTQADMLMTADMFFFQQLKQQNQLLSLEGVPALAKLPAREIDPDKTFAVSRYGLMVLAYNKDKIKEADKPKGFKDLLSPRFKGKITMPSPLESGTMLTGILFLKNMMGDKYFADLRASDMLAAGGNGAVMSRIQTGERPVGMILIENILAAKDKNLNNVEFVIPEEGALPMPSPIAAFRSTHDPELAKRVVDWFLGAPAAMDLQIKANMYSPIVNAPKPSNGPEWNAMKMQAWDMKTFEGWANQKQPTKELFQSTVLK